MVIHSSIHVSPSPGLLPTPSQPNGDNSNIFVGRSYYPLPYPLVTILEGSKLSKLISWDISITTKILKLKLDWSTSPKDSDSSSFSKMLPNNIIQAIKIYEISQLSWSISANKNKLSIKIEWQISHAKPKESSLQPRIPNVIFSPTNSPNYYTPTPKIFKNSTDSGFGSANSNSGLHSDSLNWRRSVNLPSNPNFDSPNQTTHHHDIYVAPNCKVAKASTKSSKISSTDLFKSSKSPLPVSAREVKPVNVKPESSQPQGKTPSRKESQNSNNDQSSSGEKSVSPAPSTFSSDMSPNKVDN